MQALSLAVDIPPVCIRDRLSGDGPVRRVAQSQDRRRARPDVRQAVEQRHGGAVRRRVITENDPEPRDGPRWPEFTATFGSVFWLGLVIEGFSFFVEGILIGIYVYRWERLVSRLHLRSGIPVVSAAATSAWAGAVRMGADPHWRVRRPPPDSKHQLRDTTRVRCDPDVAVPMTAEPQTARRCPMSVSSSGTSFRSRATPRGDVKANRRRDSMDYSPANSRTVQSGSTASSYGPEWKSKRWKLQVQAEARRRLKDHIRDLASKR